MKPRVILIAAIALGACLAGTSAADTNVPTTTDEARAAVASAHYEIAFIEPAPVPARCEWLTTTDQFRAAMGRMQYHETSSRIPATPAREPILITTSDRARDVIGGATGAVPIARPAREMAEKPASRTLAMSCAQPTYGPCTCGE